MIFNQKILQIQKFKKIFILLLVILSGIFISGSTLAASDNFLLNWNFENWVDENTPEHWNDVDGDGFQSDISLVGDYSLGLEHSYVSDRDIEQVTHTVDTVPDRGYGEIWVKGSGFVQLGVKAGQATFSHGDWVRLKENDWTQITYNRTASEDANPWELRIRTTARGPEDEEIDVNMQIGAAWLSSAQSPAGWPTGILYSSPREVYEGDGFDKQFTLTLANEQFEDSLDTGHIELTGDFSGINVEAANKVDSTTATVRLSGDLSYDAGTGTIAVSAAGLKGDDPLTTTVGVMPMVRTFPHYEYFDHEGEIPPGWIFQHNFYISDTGTHVSSGSYAAAVTSGDPLNEMESVVFDFTGYAVGNVSFWYRGTSTAQGSTVTVVASVDGGKNYTVKVLDTLEITADGSHHQLNSDQDLGGLAGENEVRFKWILYRDGGDISIDDVTFSAAPERIDDFTAGSLLDGGVDLTWTSPIDVTDGKYRIRWSTDSVVDWESDWDNSDEIWDDYENKNNVEFSTDTLEDESHSSSVEDLKGGVTYYFRIWLRDSEEYWSDISNGATTTVTEVISVSLSTDTYDFGEVSAGDTVVSLSSIAVTNRGNVTQKYSKYISSITLSSGSPSAWTSTDTSSGHDRFVLSSIFHGVQVSTDNFTLLDDAVLSGEENIKISDDTTFTDPNGGGNSQLGYNVPQGSVRDMWLRLDMPTTLSTAAQQKLTITIIAEKE